MRGDIALVVLALTPALMAPKGCYYGSDVVPLGYNAGGNGFGDAGAPPVDDPDCGGRAGSGGTGAAGASGSDAGGAGTAGAPTSAGTGGAGHGGTFIVLRPH